MAMNKRTVFTTITPLPPSMTRAAAVSFLHNHLEMIDLNPLVIARTPIPAPAHSPPEETTCVWYEITDKIDYIPGVPYASGKTVYTCAFHDMPWGLQTHCYAPLGLEIRDKWSVGGSLPGEKSEPQELGLGAPTQGLYLREDVDFTCNILLASFVKKTLTKSHGTLVQALAAKAEAQGVPLTMGQEEWQTKSSFSHPGSGEQHQQEPSELPAQLDATGGLAHKRTFVSSGANQGQPGQGQEHIPQVVAPGVYEAQGTNPERDAQYQVQR